MIVVSFLVVFVVLSICLQLLCLGVSLCVLDWLQKNIKTHVSEKEGKEYSDLFAPISESLFRNVIVVRGYFSC